MTLDRFNYAEISNDGFEMRVDPHKERIEFWDNLLAKYNYVWMDRGEPLYLIDWNTFGIIVVSIIAIVALVILLNNFVQISMYFFKLQDLMDIK